MIKYANAVVAMTLISLAVVGCNAGMGPAGPSEDEIRKEVSEMPPAKQIELIQSSPMSAEEKAAKIKEIETKYGVKAGAAPAQPGAPVPQTTGQ